MYPGASPAQPAPRLALPGSKKNNMKDNQFVLEWNGAVVIARIYSGGRRMPNYIEIPQGDCIGDVPKSVWAEAQVMYKNAEEN